MGTVKHGHTRGYRPTQAYRAWRAMLRRCENPSSDRFPWYGARGITVCERWHNFANFLSDLGEPRAGETLDRIDNERGYELDNCRWSTRTEQSRNRRSTKLCLADVERIRDVLWFGANTQAAIGNYFGISEATVQAIRAGRIWGPLQ